MSQGNLKEPKVSIVIPVYNVSKYLRQALDSVVNQTLKDIEIVCIDDCSTDDSREILQEYAANDDRFVLVLHKKNNGLGKTRNEGLKIAKAPYIMFLDSDDWLELDACEKAYNQISKNNDDVTFFNSNTCDIDGNLIHPDKKLKPYKKYINGETFSLKNIKGDFIIRKIAAWTKIYNRAFLLNNDIFFPEVRRGEDILFTIKVYLYAQKCSVLNSIIINYRKALAISAQKEIKCLNDAYDVIKQSYNLIVNTDDNKFILKHFLGYVIYIAFERYFDLKVNKLYYDWQMYNKSRNLLKFIDNRHDVTKFSDEFDIVKYRLFIWCPNYIIFDYLYPKVKDDAVIDKKHIIYKLGSIKLKLRLKNKKFTSKRR